METVTLHSEDFKTVHNTLCDLRSVQQRLTGILNQDLADQLHKVVKGFEKGLADAYRQDSAAFDTKSDHYEQIREGRNFRTIWSVYEVSDLTAAHPYVGATHVCYDTHWGSEDVWMPINGDRWVDLYDAADRCIRRSGDDHHVFIEGFDPVADQPQTLRLTTGS